MSLTNGQVCLLLRGSSQSRDLPSPGIKPKSPALQVDSLPDEPRGKAVDRTCLNLLCITDRSLSGLGELKATLLGGTAWECLLGLPWWLMVKHLPTMWETQVQFLGQEDLLEKEMATHSSTFAWKIPQMEEPGRLQPMGSQRVRHD